VNYLIGLIPNEIGAITRVANLNFNLNSLGWFIPSEIGQITTLMTTLSLSGNNLREFIPNEIGVLIMLEGLDIHFNYLKGSIASEIGRLLILTTLHLNVNLISGKKFQPKLVSFQDFSFWICPTTLLEDLFQMKWDKFQNLLICTYLTVLWVDPFQVSLVLLLTWKKLIVAISL
jgi:hypothetical protein